MSDRWRPAWRPNGLGMTTTFDERRAAPGSDRQGSWTTPSHSHSRWEWNDQDWEEELPEGDPWGNGDPWSGGGGTTDGWLTDSQMREFNTARIPNATAFEDGRWVGDKASCIWGFR